MSAPPQGNYFIYNIIGSSAGDKLAITWNGKINEPLTVEKLVSDNTQIWFVDIATDAGELPISPLNDFNVRASWGNDVVTVSDSLGSLWTVKETNNGYTIQDGGLSAQWGLTTHSAGEKVAIQAVDGAPTQRWILEKVPDPQ